MVAGTPQPPPRAAGVGRPVGYSVVHDGVLWDWLGEDVGWQRQHLSPERAPAQAAAPAGPWELAQEPVLTPPVQPRSGVPNPVEPRGAPPWTTFVVSRLRRLRPHRK